MNKMVEQAKRMLEEVGVNPAMLDVAVRHAEKISALDRELSATRGVAKACISNLRKEKENLEEEISCLEQEVNDLREAGLRLVATDIEFLDKLVNIDINCKEDLKKLQDVAGRRLISLKDIELYSK